MNTDPSSTSTETNATDTDQTPTVAADQTPQRPPKFQTLSIYLANINLELRRDVYKEVLAAVTKGDLPGTVHRGNMITLDMVSSRFTGANASRLAGLEEILLKNLPDLEARLEALSRAVLLRQVVKTGARGVTVDELLDLEELDFDAMITKTQKKHKRSAKADSKKKAKTAS